jgi:MYXO-CTERM domain-containing protein
MMILLVTAGIASGGQILVNPGFESGVLTPWANANDFGGTPWAITSTGCQSGSFCAENTGNYELKQTFDPIATTSITGVSFWALHPGSGVSALAYDFFYQGGGNDEFVVDTSGAGWNFFDVFAQLRSNETLVGFSIYGNSGGITRADDFSITATNVIPEPATVGFALAGLAALGVVRFRRKP